MKNVFIGTLMIMLMAATSNAALIGHWPLDGNADDTTANASNGTEVGAPQYVDGIIGQAIQFDGVDDGVTMPNESLFDYFPNPTMTVCFWAKVPYGAQPVGTVVGKLDYNISTELSTDPPQYKGVGWGLVSEPARFAGDIMAYGYDTGGGRDELTPDFFYTSNDGKWHHYALVVSETFNGGEGAAILYVDGQAQSGITAGNFAIGSNINDTPLTFGHTASYPGLKNWAGYLDDVQIYDTALTATEVQAIYDEVADAGCNVVGDINGDCDVDLNDYVLLAQDWLKP